MQSPPPPAAADAAASSGPNPDSAPSTPGPPAPLAKAHTFDINPHSHSHSVTSTHSLPSPRIAIHEDSSVSPGFERPALSPHFSAPIPTGHYQSPLRHHKRTPSQHREVKETLNARTEYTNDGTEGTQHRINQYVIKEEIGRGSYGAVHLATDQFGNEFAVKEFSKARLRKRAQSNILKRPHAAGPSRLAPGQGRWISHRRELSHQEEAEAKDALYLIREEIAIMKKLDHPNLVSLIEVLDDPEEDSLYMVLEMCKKGVVMQIGLDDIADPYSEEDCRYWFRDLILGIEYLHAQGVVHRDIKPDNLLLTTDDVLKIVDFGVSEMFEKPEQMVSKKVAGSPAFLPPELCVAKTGEVAGRPADIWSMGVSLYCLKYGRLPFRRDSVLDMYEAIRTDEIEIPPDEGADFVDLITRILDKNPETRINMHDIRNHSWVTKGGEDTLLSEEENCATIVEPPNEMEVNHAFTRKMTNLFAVMKAIHKFKGLISKSRIGTPTARSPAPMGISRFAQSIHPEISQEPLSTVPSVDTGRSIDAVATQPLTQQKSIAEEAAELIEQRKAFLRSTKSPARFPGAAGKGGERGHAQEVTDRPPRLLGIGTGVVDEPGPDGDDTGNTVSDSPTGIDFDIYDHAFETEIRRIRSQKNKSRARMYLTRFVGEGEMDKYRGDDCMVLEAGRDVASAVREGRLPVSWHDRQKRRQDGEGEGGAEGEGRSEGDSSGLQPSGLERAFEAVKKDKHRFADLVTSLTKGQQGQ